MLRTFFGVALLLTASSAFASGPAVDSKGHVRWDLTAAQSMDTRMSSAPAPSGSTRDKPAMAQREKQDVQTTSNDNRTCCIDANRLLPR